MNDPTDCRFGQIAVRLGFATAEEVEEALRAEPEPGKAPSPLDALLVERGWLTAEQAVAVLREQERAVAGPAARGLHPTGLAPAGTPPAPGPPHDTVREESEATPAKPTRPRPGSATVEPIDVGPAPEGDAASGETGAPRPRRFGKYELVAELGRGGMGVVYKAYHPGLKSYFAVKVLLAGSDASDREIDRFHREAEAAARLKHPGIVAVHDIGVEEGKTYFAMEHVEGKSLDKVLDDPHAVGIAPAPLPRSGARRAPAADGSSRRRAWGLSPAVAVRMTQDIAEALQCAHEAGVVHRDLKPANVIRDRAGRLKVMDFGLAKLVDTAGKTGATRTGAVMGTPAYMSPEQAEGRVKEVDAVSDVYQLGAILYELLTGRAPYEGETAMDVLLKVMQEDPRPLRRLNPRIPRDVETICAKAMARDKAARFATARELSEDCRRFLADEPILARPPAWWERPLRSVRRRKLLTGVAAVALAAGALAGYNQWDKWSAQERARLEQQRIKDEARRNQERLEMDVLNGLRAIASSNVKAVLAVRRSGGKMSEIEKDFLPPLKDAAAKAIAQAPSLAEPHYHLGRMYRALMRFDDARTEQDQALAKQPDYAPSLYERGVLFAAAAWRLREEKRSELLRLRASGARDERRLPEVPTDAEVETAYSAVADLKRRALADLKRVAGLGESQPDMAARARAARGLVAGLEGSPDAEQQLSESLKVDARLEEVHAALAQRAVARRDWVEAARRYEDGWRADLGYVPHVLGLGESLRQAALAAERGGRDSSDLLRHGQKAMEEALGREPGQAELWERLATLEYDAGEALRAGGGDAAIEYQHALEAFDRALAINPNYAMAANNQAMVYGSLGNVKRARGADGTDEYRKALAGYDRALAIDPNLALAAHNQANVYLWLGDAMRARGADPADEYRKALAGYTRALAINPRFASAASSQANVYASFGEANRARGVDAADEYDKALAACDRALAIDPNCAEAVNNRAGVYRSFGDAKRARGADPTDDYRKALAGYDRALAVNPNDAEVANNQANVYLWLGNVKRARSEDPTDEYRKALAGYDRALVINPNRAEAALNRANLYLALGDTKRARGADPTDEYRKAMAGYARALELNPNAAEAASNQAVLYQSIGNMKRACGADPTDEYRKALAGYDRALALNANHPDAAFNQATLYQLLGDAKRARGADPTAEYRSALVAYDRALALNPNLAGAAYNQANLYRALGDVKRTRRADPTNEYRKALAGYDRTLEINPNDAAAANNQASVYLALGDEEHVRGADPTDVYAKALAGYDRALRLNPALWQAQANRGLVLESIDKFPEAVHAYGAALALGRNAASAFKLALARARTAAAAQARSAPSAWLSLALRATQAISGGDYAAARPLYEQALACGPGDAAADPDSCVVLGNAHCNLACILALAAAGRDGPQSSGCEPPPTAAAPIRDLAFSHLAEALRLGYQNRAQLAADTDLEPLRADPRWVELLNRLKK